MRDCYVEIIGPTGSGKTTHLKVLSEDARFSIKNRNRVRQHKLMLLRSMWVWVFLQLRFCFLDTRLLTLKRVFVYHAALKTLETGEKRHRTDLGQKKVYLVDEGVFHVLLMHKFFSLKEQVAWSFFAKKQICNLVKDNDVIVFVLSMDQGLRRERLKRRHEIERERLRVADNQTGLPFGPLGGEFIRSVNCESHGLLNVMVVDNNVEDDIGSNVERVKTIIFRHLDDSEHLA